MCRVSVLMSVYNEKEEYLRSSIESVLMQTFDDFEFIIYDDATSEDNKVVLKEYAERDSRIRIFTNQKNQGLTYNLMCGVKEAKGDYIARMDSDDISKKNRLKKQVEYMDRHPSVMMLATRISRIGEKRKLYWKTITASDYLKASLLFNNGLPHPTVMLRRAFLVDNNINYNTQIKKAQDYDLWVQIAKKGKIAFLRTSCVNYRVHQGQISQFNAKEQHSFVNKVRIKQLNGMGIELSKEDENIYLEFCDGRLGMRVWNYRNRIKQIKKRIILSKNYNKFWINYLFGVRFIRNFLYKM